MYLSGGGQGCGFHASHGVPGRQSFDTHDTCSLPYGTRPAARASRGPTAVQPGGDEPMHGRRRQKESHSMLMNHDLWDSATSLSSRTTTRPPSPVQPAGRLVAPHGFSAGPAHWTMRAVQLSLLC